MLPENIHRSADAAIAAQDRLRIIWPLVTVSARAAKHVQSDSYVCGRD